MRPTDGRRGRPHAASILLMLIVIAASTIAFSFTRAVRDDSERRLLSSQADQMAQFIESLATQFQGEVASAAVVAERTNGDLGAFSGIVRAETPASQDVAGWALLERQPDGTVRTVTSLGQPAAQLAMVTLRTPEVDSRINAAFAGKFEVVGLLGTGMARRMVVASGAPAGSSRFVAYYEIPLIEAATTPNAGRGGSVMGAVGLGLYAGPTVSREGLIFTTGTPAGGVEYRTVDIGDQPITYVVWARHNLLGSVATNLPWTSCIFLLIAGLVVTVVIESNLRRRDRALHLVDELDAAMIQRDRADRERNSLEVQLRQAQRLEAVGQLAGGVAHDFNNLLAAIMSYADLLSDDLKDHPSKPDVEEIRKAARRGATLTRQLLQFGSREQASREVTESIDLNAAIGDLQTLLARAVGEEIHLRTELAPGMAPVMMARSELEQILMNLVVNARDAIDGTGTITITTDIGTPDTVRLTVSDNGCGMEEDTLARIFEPFFTTKERGRGTGLGLATVYGIVTRTGGELHVDSTAGQGSVFEVRLPLATQAPGDDEADDDPEADGGTGQTVLLVEDEGAVRRPTRRMLERAGYRVLEAADGQQAVELFGSARVELLLTDVIMPGGLNGRDVADRLRQRRPGLPVIFMSGYSADLLARRGVGDAVLQKPFNEAELLSAVASALEPAGVGK